MKFYASKFPVRIKGYHGSEDEEFLPVGSIFVVHSICHGMVEIRPVKKNDLIPLMPVSPEMINFAFTETESI